MALGDGLVQEVVQDGLGVLRKRYQDLIVLSALTQVSGFLVNRIADSGLPGAAMSLPLSVVTTAISLYVFSGQVRLVAGEVNGNRIDLREALGKGTVNLWSLFLTTFLVAMGTALGMVLLVVPGVWFLTAAGLAAVVTVMEGSAGFEAIQGSFRVTAGYRGEILVLSLIGLAVTAVVAMAIGIPTGISVFTAHSGIVKDLVSRIPTILLDPLLPVGATLVYLKLRRINGDGGALEPRIQ